MLDIHHTILPLTARLKPDPAKLWADAVGVEGQSSFKVLAPMDMVLHSATHLFHDGELQQGLRDLVDLDALMRHFGANPDFWPQLVSRAAEWTCPAPVLCTALHLKPPRHAGSRCDLVRVRCWPARGIDGFYHGPSFPPCPGARPSELRGSPHRERAVVALCTFTLFAHAAPCSFLTWCANQ